MSYTLTISGDSYSALADTIQITDNINDRSTCTFTLQNPPDAIGIGEEVIIENNGTRIFGGKIKQTKKYLISFILHVDVSCVDFNSLMDNKVVGAVFEDENVFSVFNSLVDGYLSGEGVTTGSMVADTTVTKAVFNYKYFSDCCNQIKDFTKANYNIDYNKQFTSFYRDENTASEITSASILDLTVERSQLDYRNAQYLRAGQDTTELLENQIPTPKPDGESKTFVLRFPIAEEPTIRINGVDVGSSNIGINRVEENKQWYWNKGDNFITQDANETTLTDTDTIEVDYKGLVKIVVSIQDEDKISERQAIEGGTGVYEAIEDQASIDDRSAAYDYATGLIDKYDIPEVLSLTTQEFRQAGQIIQVTDEILSVDDEYLIESVDIYTQANNFYYNMKLLSGESFGSWVEFFRKFKKDSTDLIINQNEVLVMLTAFEEEMSTNSDTEIVIYDALYPSNTLYPSDTLTPGTIDRADSIRDMFVGAEVIVYSNSNRLNSDYISGYAFEVRRDSDNEKQDIGFDGDSIDETSLIAFVGANNGYISKWYDQSGNYNNCVVETTASQQQIVNAGSYINYTAEYVCYEPANSTNSLIENTLAVNSRIVNLSCKNYVVMKDDSI